MTWCSLNINEYIVIFPANMYLQRTISKYNKFNKLYIASRTNRALMGGWGGVVGKGTCCIYTNNGEHVNVTSILCSTCVNVRIIILLPNTMKVFMSLNTFEIVIFPANMYLQRTISKYNKFNKLYIASRTNRALCVVCSSRNCSL
jgi:uncharacterized membrane protein